MNLNMEKERNAPTRAKIVNVGTNWPGARNRTKQKYGEIKMTEARGLFENVGNGIGFAALMMLVVATGCAPTGSQPSPELGALSDRWEEALNSGDIDSLVAMYTEDARIMAPNAELAQGKAAVEASFGGMIAAGLRGELNTTEATVAGDIGYHVGTYSIKTGDGVVVDRGKFTETWRKNGAGWQISNDIWNSDLPVGSGATTMVITHDVKDADHWLAAFEGPESRRDLFAQHGAANVRVFQDLGNANQVALVIDITDLGAFQAFLASPTGDTAKTEDGVIDASLRTLAEVN
jgi:ketosteroid isomerase-like protein